MKKNKIEESINFYLPEFVKINNISYRRCNHALISNSYRISYGEFDGDFFNWENKLIDKIFTEICLNDILSIYNFLCLQNPEILDEIVSKDVIEYRKQIQFKKELSDLFKKYNIKINIIDNLLIFINSFKKSTKLIDKL